MCGIIGIIGRQNIVPDLIESLKRLEYRGYDSAGVAIISEGAIQRRRAQGKIKNLETLLQDNPIDGKIGIAHTRWATHGKPTVNNAHPHATDKVAVVHNGIIENYLDLKKSLEQKGHVFESETDTEVVAHLLSALLKEEKTLEAAVRRCLYQLEGAFALAVLFHDHPDTIFCARRGSPLAIAQKDGEFFVGSDALSLAPFTNQICYLEDGDYAFVTSSGYQLYDENHQQVDRSVKQSRATGVQIGKGNFRHFMLKEIYEQPTVVGDILTAYADHENHAVHLPLDNIDLAAVRRVMIVACGTSYYAGLVGKNWLEKNVGIAAEVDVASEFRYRAPPLGDVDLCIFISQSGETADTLSAMQYAKSQGKKCLALVNVPESTLAHECDATIELHAGPEIGVASTKAFTAQITVLGCLTIALAQAHKGRVDAHVPWQMLDDLMTLPQLLQDELTHDEHIQSLARFFVNKDHAIYIGRGSGFPMAAEGALKLKELSYIHAEAYGAGELKHGPIALIDENMPVVALVSSKLLMDKMHSNIQEILSREGKVILIADEPSHQEMIDQDIQRIKTPVVSEFLSPFMFTIPLQLLAYHVALQKGTDVDQPRNLAKSVTVE